MRLVADAAIDATDEETRGSIAKIWSMRSGMELHVGAGFAIITRELIETGADAAVLSICAAAIEDEVRHAEICLALASRHDRETHDFPAPERVAIPLHEGEDAKTTAALHLVAMSCLNETIATVRLAAAIDATKSPIVERALRSILADEVVHARAGWAHLASKHVTDETRRAVGRWLPSMMEASVRGLVDENAALPEEGYEALGLPSITVTRAVVESALDDLVLPGFSRLGIDTSGLRASASRGFSAS